MKNGSGNCWGIHAGRNGDADTLFLQHGCIALGWSRIGDLSAITPNRDGFKDAVQAAYPDLKPGAIPNNAGQLFRFVHEAKVGDLVVYPSKRDRLVHVGRIESDYRYAAKTEPAYPHTRAVKWLQAAPRTRFSQGALYEVGSAMSLFQVKSYADEFRAIVDGAPVSAAAVEQDESVTEVAERTEENTYDFIVKTLSRDLKGLPFEGFVAHLLECMGYHARLTRTNEPSVDIIAHKDLLGIEPPIIKVQVKSGDGAVSDRDVSALYGKLSAGEYGLFVTLGTYSAECRRFETGKGNLRLIDADDLVKLIYEHYEQFDAKHKGLLPLRRVYVPELLADGAE